MAKEIIVLSQSSNGTQVNYNGLFWFAITSKAVPQTAGSAWVAEAGVSTGPSGAENTAIQNGSVKEEPWGYSFPVATPISAIEAFLQQAWTNRNAQLNGVGGYQYYGS